MIYLRQAYCGERFHRSEAKKESVSEKIKSFLCCVIGQMMASLSFHPISTENMSTVMALLTECAERLGAR